MWVALGAIFLWRCLFSAWANLIPDECSYWAWSRRLDWSYFDNSGMVAYLIRLSTALFGGSTPLSVRFPFLVLSGFTTYLIYRSSRILFGDSRRSLLVAVLFNLTPVALLGGSAAMHDNALMFFWSLAFWAAARLLASADGRWFYVIGIAAGLAIQSKYTGVLVLPCVLLFLLWNPNLRARLLTREPWIGASIAVALTLPIVWWNVTHDWASLYHVLFIGSGSPSLWKRIGDGLGYHAAQFGLVSPIFCAGLYCALGWAFLRNVRRPNPGETLLLSFSVPLALFGILAFKGHVEANWAFMGYLSAGILAVEAIFGGKVDGQRLPWKWFGRRSVPWALGLAVGPVFLVVVHAWVGLLPAGLEKKIVKADRIIWETRGWAGLGRQVGSLRTSTDVLAADSYQLCALLEFNVPGQPFARYLAPWKRPTQFDVWHPSFDDLKGRDILYVSPIPLEPSSAARTTIYENFARIEPLEPYRVMYHGVPIRDVYLYRCSAFDPLTPRRLGPRSLRYREE